MNSQTKSSSQLPLGILVCCFVAAAACKSTTPSTTRLNQDEIVAADGTDDIASQFDVVMNFSGKGTAIIWDLGVVQGLLNQVKPLQDNRAIFTGNSSGSFAAAYFSCFGLSQATAAAAIERFSQLDRNQIPEKAKSKALRLATGMRTETDATYLQDFIAESLTVNGRPCTPTFPFLVAAANGDVVENRTVAEGGKGPMIKPHPSAKQVADGTYDVHGVPSSVEAAAVNPGNLIGKACTYFVDKTVFRVLSRIPADEIQCDLRLVATHRDLVYAVLASVSEPTFYFPVADVDPNVAEVFDAKLFRDAATDPFWVHYTPTADKIVAAQSARPPELAANLSRRYYVGGFMMSCPGQDLRRALPHLRILSTGRRALGPASNDLLRAFYLLDANALYQQNRWWMDLEVQPSVEEEKMMNDYATPNETVVGIAVHAAEACVKADLADPSAPTSACAPVAYHDPDGDSKFDFLVTAPHERFLKAVDGTPIETTGRRLPAAMIVTR